MMPPCMHCGEQFDQHEVRGDERWCRDGKHYFDVTFQINPEVVDFIKDHPDKSGDDLADLWIKRVRARRNP